eukprot:TRINITY_DN2821_c0_g6_i1.p1 TRINITY_DN2821_c0_g6~~TRINITY_DN2821_c0_g6_i1.p1  ORF type:complete len:1979 (+),score=560.03 TRINITY_DN2821_c0_g6_i1:565-5937(+)
MERYVQADTHIRHGAEKMGQLVNHLLERVLLVVARFGGDVLQFSGDAVLVTWVNEPDDDEFTRRRAAILAAQCAEEIVAEGEVPAEDGTVLRLHVGLSYGSLTLLTVGGFKDRWKCVCIGKSVHDAGNASVIAQAGQIVAVKEIVAISNKAVNGSGVPGAEDYILVGRVPKVKTLPTPPAPLQPTSAQVHMLVTFIPSVVAMLLAEPGRAGGVRSQSPQSGNSAGKRASVDSVTTPPPGGRQPLTAGEMRLISCIFLKLDIEHTRDGFSVKLNESYTLIQKMLRTYGGSCNKLMYDDKGLTCLCVFGLPGSSHEDDPSRSVAFSRRVADALEYINVDVSIGITRSKSYCGVCGCSTRKEYTVLGDGVNLAARLMVLAFAEEGAGDDLKVFVDEATKEGAEAMHEFEGPRMVNVKGKEFPVKTFRLLPSELPWGMGSRQAPSLRESSLSSSVLSRASVDLPISPRSAANRHSIASGITPMTPLSRSLRNMARMSSASGSDLSAATHETASSRSSLFPCTTANGAVLVLERIEEMKSIGYLVDRLTDPDQGRPSHRKRKARRREVSSTAPASKEGGDAGATGPSGKDGPSTHRGSTASPPPPSLPPSKQSVAVVDEADEHVSLSHEEDFCGPSAESKSQGQKHLSAREKKRLRRTPRSAPLSVGKREEDAVSTMMSETGSQASDREGNDDPEGKPPREREKAEQAPAPAPTPPQAPPQQREREREKPRPRLVSDPQQGKPRIAVIDGEAGMGKSLLLHKACAVARDRSVPYHLVSTTSAMRNRPYGALGTFLEELRTDDTLLMYDAQQQHLLSTVLAGSTAAAMPPSGTAPGYAGEGRHLSLETQLPQLNGMIRDMLLAYMRGSSLLLIIDDAQWLDDLSWALLSFLAEEIPTTISLLLSRRIKGYDETAFQTLQEVRKLSGVSFLEHGDLEPLMHKSTYSGRSSLDESVEGQEHDLRRESLDLCRGTSHRTRFLRETAAGPGAVSFVLTPLSMTSCTTFYKMVLGVKKVSNDVIGYAYSRSCGNPGVAERLFVTLNDRHALVTLGEGVAEFTPTASIDIFAHLVPSETESMIMSMTDRLPTECQYYLKIMAALGTDVKVSLVAAVADISCDLMHAYCEQFVAANILQPDVSSFVSRTPAVGITTAAAAAATGSTSGSDMPAVVPLPTTSHYVFRSEILRDVVYYRMLHHQRMELHKKLAEAIALELGSDDAINDVVVDHLAMAQDPRAADHLVARSEAHLAQGSLKAAADVLTKVHDCAKHLPDSDGYMIHTRHLITAHQDLGNCHLARPYLEEHCARLNMPDHSSKGYLQLAIPFQRLFLSLPSCCVSDSTSDSLLVDAERAMAYKLRADVLLFEGKVDAVRFIALMGLRIAHNVKRRASKAKVKAATKGRIEGFSEARHRSSVVRPEAGWAAASAASDPATVAERAQAVVDEVHPALCYALGYLDLCCGSRSAGEAWAGKSAGEGKGHGYKLETVPSPGLLFFESQRYVAVAATINNMKQVYTSLCRTEKTSMIQLSLCLRISAELLRGSYIDATMLHKELANKTGNGQSLRFSLYAVALQGIICAGTNASESLYTARERMENALLYARGKATGDNVAPLGDPTLLLLMGCSLSLGFSRDKARHPRASLIVELYNLADLLIDTDLLTPLHLVCFPILMEVFVAAKDVKNAQRVQERYVWAAARFPALEARCEFWKGSLSMLQGDCFTAVRTWKGGVELAVRMGCGYEEALCKMRVVGLPRTDREMMQEYAASARHYFVLCGAEYDNAILTSQTRTRTVPEQASATPGSD